MKQIYTLSHDVEIINRVKDHENTGKKKTFEEVLDEIGFGRVQIEISIAITLLLFTVLNETMGISFIIPAAQCDLKLSSKDKGILSASTFAGIMISSMFWGYLADTRGRRLIILYALLFSTIFSILAVFVPNFTMFAVCRFLTGIFTAGFSVSLYAYVGEFNTNKNRSAIISSISCAIGLSAIIQPLLAMWIYSYDWSFEIYEGFLFRPWRLLLFLYTSSGIIAGFWLLKFPESPKFFMAIGEDKKALEVLKWMHQVNKGKGEPFNITEIESQKEKSDANDEDTWKEKLKEISNQVVPLLKPPYVVPFVACCVMLFGVFANVGGLALFFPDTLNQLSKSNDSNLLLCDVIQRHAIETGNENNGECDDSVDTSSLIDSSYLGFAYLIGYIILTFIVRKIGRLKISIFTLVTSSTCGFLLNIATQRYLIVILYCLFLMMCGVNVALINGASVDLFPTHLRAMAVCLSMLSGRLGTTVASYLIGIFIETYCLFTYNIVSGLTLALAALTLLIPDSNRK